MTSYIPIDGNTYPHREALKRLGGRWDPVRKAWMVPAGRADEARALVAGGSRSAAAPAPSNRRKRPAPLSAAPDRRIPEPGPGERLITRASIGRGDGYDAGATYLFDRVAGGGGPDGYCWTVLKAGKARHTQYTDDTREGEWYVWAICRPATDDEAAPVVARTAAAAARKAAETELRSAIDAMRSEERGARTPEWVRGLAPTWSRRISDFSSEDLYAGPDGVCVVRPVYDDDPVIRIALAGTPEHDRVVAALAALRGSGA